MDNMKTGQLIFELRKEKGLTQAQLAEQLGITDKAVSKWERGMGCPDVSLLADLAQIFSVSVESLLSGDLTANDITGGNMKNTKFYICPHCGNVIAAMTETAVSCCGKKLQENPVRKADDAEKLSMEIIENEYFITSEHSMNKDHYISFVALLTGDGLLIKKQYPEWNLQVRMPVVKHGKLLWYCTKHGLMYQIF